MLNKVFWSSSSTDIYQENILKCFVEKSNFYVKILFYFISVSGSGFILTPWLKMLRTRGQENYERIFIQDNWLELLSKENILINY